MRKLYPWEIGRCSSLWNMAVQQGQLVCGLVEIFTKSQGLYAAGQSPHVHGQLTEGRNYWDWNISESVQYKNLYKDTKVMKNLEKFNTTLKMFRIGFLGSYSNGPERDEDGHISDVVVLILVRSCRLHRHNSPNSKRSFAESSVFKVGARHPVERTQ